MNYLKKVVIVMFCVFCSLKLAAQTHPNIILTKANINVVKSGIGKYPLLKKSYQEVKERADFAITHPIIVPTPKDGGGGYTHEQHKRNYSNILDCGIAYQITGNQKYADYIKNILLVYAAHYKEWGLHPKRKSDDDSGRIFWQCLNDFVWQFYVIQGYDMAYNAISTKDRAIIEEQLFIPILKFITEEHYDVFNMIHNHGTWALAAVGMTGYVLHQPKYVEMALKGSNLDGKTGYFAQLDQLFSPDGYYSEGPYYQRYAMLPFVLFAKAINNYQPGLKIFDYRDKLLAKAINTSLQLTYTDKTFFPINDAIKDKTYESIELVYGLDIAYADIEPESFLLDIANRQGRVIVSDAGLKVAKAIAEGKTKPFKYVSQWIRDGASGQEGGLGILRYGKNEDQECLLLKAASQGMGHGHFDRLNILFYDNGTQIFEDYGSARFINIDTKGVGNYLPENNTWAKQTVAHNTLVVDEQSDFKGKVDVAQKYHPDLVYFKADSNLQVVSAKEDNAYADVKLLRTSALVKILGYTKPLLIDVFKATSKTEHQYDLPFWYAGQLVNSSFDIDAKKDDLKALGTDFGYQHLWFNAQNQLDDKGGFVSILNNKRFYTIHFITENPLQVKLVSVGANDPHMNLVDGKAFILSQPKAKNQTFISITEVHGGVDPVNETVNAAASSISGLKIITTNDEQTAFSFKFKDKVYQYMINYQNKNNYVVIK
ncbi:alginate lyase family protein [Pedobacter sp. SD-b]|uniref:Alginate lyase family protein n=1 Tax=Pedobacter segetis TaxID=2793069 RepID=A0ABS1BHN7_9SPHI|nr:heparinase II/III family protein [Pedobacter segetis]MBK0382358.1 alginate lyase family protein [Pedobacter segetis]